ncbi:shikimate kinase [Qipengyuania marisflavi]|uniref:Shikimate kinase n=1 Tax=Qipengyuania marisflavi TaxID=2486356 RepID=A0A5S3PAD7_9SPHN|nr:shikimate kinase [Qipengyuania marisflavi]TMM49705.1 shikimate kinase [Qipengyuania marisflavi]
MTQTTPSLSDMEIATIALRIDRPIVLVGLMGVGKTTVGRKVAALLGRKFVDADEEIERAANRKVAEIFAAHGEVYFRDGERRVLARLIGEESGVIATGGGAFVDDQTRTLVLEKGIAVWLDCDIATLVERTSRRDTRPLLRDGDPEAILSELKEARNEAYAEAPIRVVTNNGPQHDTALRIIEAIGKWL